MDASKETLEGVLNQFAEMICRRQGIQFRNGGYKVLLEEEMLADIIIEAGNPVVIKLHWRVFAEGLRKRNMAVVKYQLQHALEVGARRMLHTLSQNPAAPALVKESASDRRWTKVQEVAKKFPTILDPSRLNITTFITVTVQDKVTGEMWTEKDYLHKRSIGELERKAVREISRVVLSPEPETEEGE